MIFMYLGVMKMMFVVLLGVYIHTEQAENMPDHGGNRTYDYYVCILEI